MFFLGSDNRMDMVQYIETFLVIILSHYAILQQQQLHKFMLFIYFLKASVISSYLYAIHFHILLKYTFRTTDWIR